MNGAGKKGLDGREETASVNTPEGVKGRGKETVYDSREGIEAERKKKDGAFMKGKKVQRSLIRGNEGEEVVELLKEWREWKKEMNKIKE